MTSAALRHFAFPDDGRAVAVRVTAPDLQAVLDVFYPAYRRDPAGLGGRVETIVLERQEEGLYHLLGPSGDWWAEAPGEAVALLESELTDALLSAVDRFVMVHGAAVQGRAGPVLLVGPSGSGKSSLTAGLYAAGRAPLADDTVLLDPATGGLEPFGRAVRVHRDAAERLGTALASVPDVTRRWPPYVWIRPPRPRSAARLRPPRCVVFLNREDAVDGVEGGTGQGAHLQGISGADALRELLVARFGPGRPDRDFGCLAELAGRAEAYRLTFSDLAEALRALETLVGSPGAVVASSRR